MTEIKPGMFGLSVISGKAGMFVRIGQNILEGQKCTFTHAFLVVDNNMVIEAQPGGAILSPLTKYTSRPEGQVLFSDLPIQLAVQEAVIGWEKIGYNYALTEAERAYEDVLRRRVTSLALGKRGTPYNYLDYFALALERFNVHIKAVTDRVERTDRMICSQLVDWAYGQCGIHVFNDGRLPQDVTPGDLEWYVKDYE